MKEACEPQVLETLAIRYTKLLMSGDPDKEVPDGFDVGYELCQGPKSFRNKRKRSETTQGDGSREDESCESARQKDSRNSHVKLTASIAQYLLSRVPLPTSRTDLQKRFVKAEESLKVDLDSVLYKINEKFKSALGLGIFGLDKSQGPYSSNPKYYVVQLNRSRAHLDLVYQFGSINYKSIGELVIPKNQDELVSNKLCNSFLTFLAFVFGFFDVTYSIEDLVLENDDSSQIVQNSEQIEIPINYLFELLSEFSGVPLNLGKFFEASKPFCTNYLCSFHFAPEKTSSDLESLFHPKPKAESSAEQMVCDLPGDVRPSKVCIILYILSKIGYLIPTFPIQKESSRISGFKNGPLLKWDSEQIKAIINSNLHGSFSCIS
ncbi:hypothetical protein HWI79_2038 [Cryptosporidium felis]|nr:hypothetical protein HWI79_2038 [Cryptosporidium felis]